VEEEVGRQPLRLLPAVPLRPRRRSPLKRKRKKRSRMRTWVLVSLIKFLAYKERPDQVHRAEGRCPIISDLSMSKILYGIWRNRLGNVYTSTCSRYPSHLICRDK
jgi:hypothetical protein